MHPYRSSCQIPVSATSCQTESPSKSECGDFRTVLTSRSGATSQCMQHLYMLAFAPSLSCLPFSHSDSHPIGLSFYIHVYINIYIYIYDPRCIPERRIKIPDESDILKAAANLVTHTKNKPHRKLTLSNDAKDQWCMQHECLCIVVVQLLCK